MAMRVMSNTAHPFLSVSLYIKTQSLATGKAYFVFRERYFWGKEVKNVKVTKKVPAAQPLKFDPFDPLGSYTGCPKDPEEKPVQDADDL